MATNREPIGLVAGSGATALEFAARAKEKGHDLAIVALSSSIQQSLETFAHSIIQLAPTQPKKALKFFKGEKIRRVGLLGKVEKNLLFQGLKFDLDAFRFISQAHDLADMTIMKMIIEYFEENDMEIIPQTEFLDHLLTPEGPLGRKKLKKSLLKDVRYGFRLAREVARLDIGQTVVVKKGAIVAVEGIEGTDEAIRRGCALAGKGAVVCKVARPDQDHRFDVPVVGPKTVQVAVDGCASALIIEAGTTFLLDKSGLIQRADEAGVALVGWTNDEES